MTYLLVSAFAIITTVIVHEFGHAYVENYLSKSKRKFNFSPLDHIDPIGMLMMITVGIGWTKPVQTSSSNFNRKTMKRDLILVYLAGPAFNLLAAILCAVLLKFTTLMSARILLMAIINLNLTFSAFSLLPLPMLDGWNIAKQFIPYKYYDSVYQFESMSMFVFLIIIMTNTHMTMMRPIYNILSSIVNLFL